MDSKKPSTTKKVETAKKGGLDSSRESSVDKSKIKTKTTSKKSPAKKVEKPVKDSYLQKAEEEMEKDEKARAEQKLAQRKHNVFCNASNRKGRVPESLSLGNWDLDGL